MPVYCPSKGPPFHKEGFNVWGGGQKPLLIHTGHTGWLRVVRTLIITGKEEIINTLSQRGGNNGKNMFGKRKKKLAHGIFLTK